MRYQTFVNENSGEPLFEKPPLVTSGYRTVSGLDLGEMAANAPFKLVAGSIYTSLMADDDLSWVKKTLISLPGTYVPNMIRKYMDIVRRTRKAYRPGDKSFWMNKFVEAGFNMHIAEKFFQYFYELYQDGAVAQSIWYPGPLPAGSGNGADNGAGNGGGNGGGLSTGAMVGIGLAAVAGIAGAYFIFK